MDRRVKYTHRVLNESLIRLLDQKEIKKITVKELCSDADVNRSTYYAHFTDPYDQLEKLKSGIVRELAEYVREIDITQIPSKQRLGLILKNVLQYIEPRKQMFRILLEQSRDWKLQQDFLKLISDKAFPETISSGHTEKEREYLLIYIATGGFGMFYHWLMSDDSTTPEQLAQMIDEATSIGFRNYCCI